MPSNYTIQIRRDTSTNWNSINPILSSGEAGLEIDTYKLKYGNGLSAWNSLGYFNDLTPYTPLSTYISTSGVYTTVNNLSANWDNTYTTFSENSGNYTTSSQLTGTYAKLDGSNHPFTYVKTPKIYPNVDSVSAIQFTKANGTTNVLNIDTTNGRIGIGTTAPTAPITVVGDISVNAPVSMQFASPNTSTASKAQMVFGRTWPLGSEYYGILQHWGTGFTTNGVQMASRTGLLGYDINGVVIGTAKTSAGTPLLFSTYGLERMRIDGDGTIVVGSTATQTGRFNIIGSSDIVQFKLVQNATQTNVPFAIYASNGTTVRLSQTASGDIRVGHSTTDSIFITGTTSSRTGAAANNTALGVGALQSLNNDGTNNTAVGRYAGLNVTNSIQCTFIGVGAGQSIGANAQNHTFVGCNAGVSFSPAYYTTAIGAEALKAIYGNTNNGNYNTALGGAAGYGINTGSYNTFLGCQAGGQGVTGKTGSNNVITGYYAGYGLTSGASNVFLGYYAGNRQTTASNLLIIDNMDRTSSANEATKALIYGTFNASPSAQSLTVNGAINPASYQKTVNGSVSGSAIFCEPFAGTSYKSVMIYLSGLGGTASYNYPVSFTYTPQIISQYYNTAITTLTLSSCVVSGDGSSGFIEINGF